MSIKMELLTNNASSPDPLHQEVVYKRPLAYCKMESLIKEMQDPETGVPVRDQHKLLSSVPACFAGYDIVEWLMERLSIEDSGTTKFEAVHLANLLCQHGYFFPVGDNRNYSVKDDSALFRFQTPYYWPSQVPTMDNVDYAIYLAKRTLRNKQKHALDDYEIDAYNELRKNLGQKWDFIAMQADEQVRISKDRRKLDKVVIDSQEKAFWRVLRPPPGVLCCVETPPMYKADFHAQEGTKQIRRTNILEEIRAEVDLLRTSCIRTRIKVSQAFESLASHCDSYHEHDPFLVASKPSNPANPWHINDRDEAITYWIINAPLVDVPTERRVKKWGISTEDLVFDPTGLREFTTYLKKEYCHENIRFWLAVRDLRYGPACQLRTKAQQIYNEFLSPGAPCEINIDMRTMEAVQKELHYMSPSRFTFDPAADHVYAMLLKKDCYPRFIRSEHYKGLIANALQLNQKKRFDKLFSFVAPGKKKSSTTMPPSFPLGTGMSLQSCGYGGGDVFNPADDIVLFSAGKCDLMSASSQETNDKLSIMADCPYRGDMIPDGGRETLSQASIDDVCPWESMEKLPSEKSASTTTAVSAPVPIPIPKPSTSAAAVAAIIHSSSPKQLISKKSEDRTQYPSHPQPQQPRSGPPSKQSSVLSKQGSIGSTKQEDTPSKGSQISLQRQESTGSKHNESSTESIIQRKQSISSVTASIIVTSTECAAAVAGTSLPPSTVVAPLIASSTVIASTSIITPTTSSSVSITPSSSTLIPSEKSESTIVKEVENADRMEKTVSKGTISRGSSKDVPAVTDDDGDGGVYCGGSSSVPTTAAAVMNKFEPPPVIESANMENNRKKSISNVMVSSTTSTSPPEKEKVPMSPSDKRKMSREEDVCPWDHENGTRPETSTFVKTYSTLGYL